MRMERTTTDEKVVAFSGELLKTGRPSFCDRRPVC
jgi:hypothetical protein